MPLVWSYIRRWARGWTFPSHKHRGRKRSPTLPVCHLLREVAVAFAPSRSQSPSKIACFRSSVIRQSPAVLGLKCGRGRRGDSTPVRRFLSRSLIQFLDKANIAHCDLTCPHWRTVSKNRPLNCQITQITRCLFFIKVAPCITRCLFFYIEYDPLFSEIRAKSCLRLEMKICPETYFRLRR